MEAPPVEATAAGNGSSPGLDVQPDIHETVVAAVEVAAERGRPLGLSQPASALPQTAPWNQLPAAAIEGLRRVNMMEALAGIEPGMRAVETELEHLITTPVKLIADIASHTLSAGGKRLRPALALLAAQVCGDDAAHPHPRVVTCAAAVELTHTTTLLHDDVVDAAETRRGKPSANLIWAMRPVCWWAIIFSLKFSSRPRSRASPT